MDGPLVGKLIDSKPAVSDEACWPTKDDKTEDRTSAGDDMAESFAARSAAVFLCCSSAVKELENKNAGWIDCWVE